LENLAKAAEEMALESKNNSSKGTPQDRKMSIGAEVIGKKGPVPLLSPGDSGFPNLREAALPDGEFEELFGMEKEKFYKLRKWKQDQKKKEVGLF